MLELKKIEFYGEITIKEEEYLLTYQILEYTLDFYSDLCGVVSADALGNTIYTDTCPIEFSKPNEIAFDIPNVPFLNYLVTINYNKLVYGSFPLKYVRTILDNAFNNLPNLEELVIPSGAWSFDNIFNNVPKLVTVDTSLNYDLETIDQIVFSLERRILYYYPEGLTRTSYSVPYGVREIVNNAFAKNDYLISIELPEWLTTCNGAFMDLPNLVEFFVDSDNDDFYTIDGVLFTTGFPSYVYGDNVLIKYPQGKTASDYIIPDNTDSIYNYAFYNNEYLTEVTLNEEMEEILAFAFSKCGNLVNISLNEGLERIDDYAFNDTGLTFVDLPASLERIGENVFAYTALEVLVIRRSIDIDGDLTELLGAINESVVSIGLTIYAPDDCIVAYKSTLPWSFYEELFEPISNLVIDDDPVII